MSVHECFAATVLHSASGDLVALGARALSTFTIAGEEYRLRLLDKRRDLLTYLRFADVSVDTCYRSDANDHAGKRKRTIEIWKDPLWFCLRIERSARGGFRPIGFTFGDFVDLDGRIGIVLSGLYMRPNVPAARLAIVRAIRAWAVRSTRNRRHRYLERIREPRCFRPSTSSTSM